LITMRTSTFVATAAAVVATATVGAAAVNAALTASSADLARRATAVCGRRAAWLSIYPAWCAFAFVRSTHIWLLNRRRRIDAP
jgi:benzodiazapine receptor